MTIMLGAGRVLVTLAFLLSGPAGTHVSTQDGPFTVRITSPLGRTGLPGPIRIVAQLSPAPTTPHGVWIYVDQTLVRGVTQPPYVAEWVDDNPFERRQITVVARDGVGREATDRVVLEPYEVSEAAEVSSVLLEASVQDEDGRFVRDLKPESFSVEEDGVAQTLDLVSQEVVGATFGMLIDASNSMSRRMDFVHRTATTLAGYMTSRDRMIIAPFARTLGAITGPTHDSRTIGEAIDAIRPSGGTAILDSLIQLCTTLKAADGRRAIVLITDGYDEHSQATFEEALAAAKSAHTTVYIVGIGGVAGISLKGERLLKQLANETGGRAFFPSRDIELSMVHDTLTSDVQNRYLITYTPANQQVDGTWRAIAVRTTPEYTVRTRPGYFAPSPPALRPNIEFTVTDATGRYLDVAADDLEVIENGTAQAVDTFQEAVQPVSIVLALDASGSMRKKEADVIASARTFIDALRPEDRLAMILFADKAEIAHDLSTKREISHKALEEYKAIGGTALYDALTDALLLLQRTPGRRVVVVMTDGRDENNPGTAPGSLRTFGDVLRQQKETLATIFGIGLGTKVDSPPLERMASVSGGQALFPTEVTDLETEYQRVIEDLRRRYVVSYSSTNPQRDGKWREVTIRVKDRPGAQVRTTGGYFAPSR